MISLNTKVSLSRSVQSAYDFFLWWKEQLSGILPKTVLTTRRSDQQSGFLLRIVSEGYCLNHNEPMPLLTLGEYLLAAKRSGELKSTELRLVLDPTCYLKRTISNLRLPLSALRRAAELDLLTETPFAMEDVKLLITEGPQKAEYYIVRLDILQSIKEQLSLASVGVSTICMGNEETKILSGLHGDYSSNRKRQNKTRVVDSVLVVLMVLTLAYCVYQFLEKTTEAVERLDFAITAADQKAHEARFRYDQYSKRLNQLDALNVKQKNSLEFVIVWEELSRILPDTAFLTDFIVKDGRLEITGFSTKPAELIGSIEGSSLFEHAQFASPVVKIPGFKGDRFFISFERERE